MVILYYPHHLKSLFLGMQLLLGIVTFLQVTTFVIRYAGAQQGNCSVDAILSYITNGYLYFFKGDKYARWNDGGGFVEFVHGKFIKFL